MTRIVVADVTIYTPEGPRTFQASRVYYPQHPANAVEFDDVETDQRIMAFGPTIVRHLAPDTSPKAPMFTALPYFGFWLLWAGLIIAAMWAVTR